MAGRQESVTSRDTWLYSISIRLKNLKTRFIP